MRLTMPRTSHPKTDWRKSVGQLILAALIACVLGGIAQKWLIYRYPKVEVHAAEKKDTAKVVKRNVVKTTTKPDGTVIEERDLSTTNTTELTSSLVSSLSVPVFPPSAMYGVTISKDILGNDFSGGVLFRPFQDVEFSAKTNLLLNRLEVGVGVYLK